MKPDRLIINCSGIAGRAIRPSETQRVSALFTSPDTLPGEQTSTLTSIDRYDIIISGGDTPVVLPDLIFDNFHTVENQLFEERSVS